MKIIANTKTVSIENAKKLTSGAFNNDTIAVELSPEFEGLTVFVTFNNQKTLVVANEIKTPCLMQGVCYIGVYAVDIQEEQTILRYSPTPCEIFVEKGTWNKKTSDADTPTTSEAEKIYSLIVAAIEAGKLKGEDAKINGKNAIDITAGDNVTITDTETGIEISATGSRGPQGASISSLATVYDSVSKRTKVTFRLNNGQTIAPPIYIPDGEKGEQGIPGPSGQKGEDAKINGRNTIDITAGDNVTITDTETGIEISATGSSGGTVNDVKVNGTSVVSDKIASITVPTSTSDLTNDSGFVTDVTVNTLLGQKQDKLSQQQIININDVPNKASKDYVDNEISKVEMAKFPNAIINGTPIINNGQISGFSTANYLQFPFQVDLHNKDFEIQFHFKTDVLGVNQTILGSDHGLNFAIHYTAEQKNVFAIGLSWDGETWDVVREGTHEIQASTNYLVNISWKTAENGYKYYIVKYSIDNGVNWINDIIIQSGLSLATKTMYIGVNFAKQQAFQGILNFNYAKLYIANILVWQGMDDVGIASRLAIDVSNIDEAGKQRIRGISGEIIADSTDEATENTKLVVGTGQRVEMYTKDEVDNLLGHTYSTEEKVVGTWFGQPLYEKTIIINESIETTTKSFIHNIQNMDITIDVKSAFYNENNNYMIGNTYIYYPMSGVNCSIYIKVDRNSVNIYRTAVPTAADIPNIGYITIRYTKTTDSEVTN